MTKTRDRRTLTASVRGATVAGLARLGSHLELVARLAAKCRTPARQRRTVQAGDSWR